MMFYRKRYEKTISLTVCFVLSMLNNIRFTSITTTNNIQPKFSYLEKSLPKDLRNITLFQHK